MKANILKSMCLCLSLAIVGCSQEGERQKTTQDWNPAIDETLTNLDQNNILTFGKTNKEDGRYCYVSYEGILRNSTELLQTQKHLESISKEIAKILKTEYARTTLDISKKSNGLSLEQLSQQDLDYINKKAELECLKVLTERQIAKYIKRNQDNRITSK